MPDWTFWNFPQFPAMLPSIDETAAMIVSQGALTHPWSQREGRLFFVGEDHYHHRSSSSSHSGSSSGDKDGDGSNVRHQAWISAGGQSNKGMVCLSLLSCVCTTPTTQVKTRHVFERTLNPVVSSKYISQIRDGAPFTFRECSPPTRT